MAEIREVRVVGTGSTYPLSDRIAGIVIEKLRCTGRATVYGAARFVRVATVRLGHGMIHMQGLIFWCYVIPMRNI